MIKAVLFDYGGVLTAAGGKGSVQKIVSKHHKVDIENVDIEDLIDPLRRGKISGTEFFAKLAERYHSNDPLSEEQFFEMHDLTKKSALVYELAENLRKHGIKTGILSNIFQFNADLLRKAGLYDGFDPLILSCEVKTAKPDIEIYELAVRELGVKPDEIIFVDDQEKCWPSAQRLGMKIVKAVSPEQIVHDVKALIRQDGDILL
jgi:epoxide hydrolase-like predicted phosphatase